MPLGNKATRLKTAKQDQVQCKFRILFLVTDEKKLFQSEAQACQGRKEEHTNRKHPFPTAPQKFTSIENKLNSWEALGLLHANLQACLRFDFAYLISRNPDC